MFTASDRNVVFVLKFICGEKLRKPLRPTKPSHFWIDAEKSGNPVGAWSGKVRRPAYVANFELIQSSRRQTVGPGHPQGLRPVWIVQWHAEKSAATSEVSRGRHIFEQVSRTQTVFAG